VDVGKWLKTHLETSDFRKLAKRGPDPRRVELGKLLAELDGEVENARSEHMYVRQLRDTAKTREQKVYATPHFEFASTDLAAAIDETDVLMSEDNGGRSIDDSVSSKLAANQGLTDAELLALKVYTTGDYYTINPALDQDAGAGARFKSNLVKIPGAVRTAGKPEARPVAPAFDWNAAPQHRAAAQATYDTARMKYDADMVKFNALAAPLLADTTKLAEAKADALRHAALVERAISKLEPFDQMAYRGERWDAATFKTMYQDKLKAVMTPAARFLSASTSEAKAETFARGTDPSDKQEGVLVKLKCNGVKARDIHLLSHVRHELEVLLLPGAKIYVDAITETDPKRRAQLGYRYIVQAHEVP
jgi:hypothetical protein